MLQEDVCSKQGVETSSEPDEAGLKIRDINDNQL